MSASVLVIFESGENAHAMRTSIVPHVGDFVDLPRFSGTVERIEHKLEEGVRVGLYNDKAHWFHTVTVYLKGETE